MVRATFFLGGLTLGVLAGLAIATYSESLRVKNAERRAAEFEATSASQRAQLEAATKELEFARARLTQMADLEAAAAADKKKLADAERDAKDRWIANRVYSAEVDRLRKELAAATRSEVNRSTSRSTQSDFTVDGFAFTECQLESLEEGCLFRGRVTNNTGRDFNGALFDISLYDDKRRVIDVRGLLITNFTAGQTRAFSDEFNSEVGRDTSAARQFEVVYTGGY
jgi:hypothetical protein